MPCLVCGTQKPVKSHLIPRALVHDIKGEHTSVFEGSAHRTGYKMSQSGPLDDSILCGVHERSLSESDRYGVDFCRSFDDVAVKGYQGRGFDVPNRKPGLLYQFVCSTVWRTAVSNKTLPADVGLGHYEPILQADSFANSREGPELSFLVWRSQLTSSNHAVSNLIAVPHKIRIDGVRFFRFLVSGLTFDLKVDRRPDFPALDLFKANGKDPIIVVCSPPLELALHPGLANIFNNMGPPKGKHA